LSNAALKSSSEQAPIRNLRGFERIRLRAGDVPESKVDISVGGGQPIGNTPRVEGKLVTSEPQVIYSSP